MAFKDKVIANIKNEMIRRGVSNTELASRINTSQSVISQILSGKYTITLDRIEEIAHALNVTPEKLLNATEITTEDKIILQRYNQVITAIEKYIKN